MFAKAKNNPNAIPDDSKPGKKGKCSVFCFPDINADDLLGVLPVITVIIGQSNVYYL
jgi:hypothetical protein